MADVMPLKQITFALGFSGQSSFTTAFRRATGQNLPAAIASSSGRTVTGAVADARATLLVWRDVAGSGG